jgi:OOP family OmpA-OmpF porin
MKNLLSTIAWCICLLSSYSAMAQYQGAPHGITFKYVAIDYYTPQVWANEIPGEGGFFKDANKAMDLKTIGVELGYTRHIKDWLGVVIPAKFGTVGPYGIPLDPGQFTGKSKLFGSVDALLKFKYFKPKQFINPSISAGLGAMKIEKKDIDFHVPISGILDFRLTDNLYLQLESQYRIPLVNNAPKSMHHSLGFLFLVGGQEVAPPPPPPVEVKPMDTDGDGIADNADDCPSVKGLAQFAGCPDSDGDGIKDSSDNCPNQAGPASNNGCPLPTDSDGDGVVDDKDRCPNEAGPASNNGCPLPKDSDGDGVIDANDNCPNEAGPASNNGCPLPKDSDGDGVIDANDKCPNTKGLPQFAGCPDTDGDGIEDARDKCPSTAGPASNNGCPEIKQEDKEVLTFATKNVEFETGKSVLTADSKAILDKVAEILTRYPDYSLRISGHTDNVGSQASNQTLSENRAKACFDYLASKGVASARMTHAGFGPTRPVADNKTAAGRQQNRRVEFDIYLK